MEDDYVYDALFSSVVRKCFEKLSPEEVAIKMFSICSIDSNHYLSSTFLKTKMLVTKDREPPADQLSRGQAS